MVMLILILNGHAHGHGRAPSRAHGHAHGLAQLSWSCSMLMVALNWPKPWSSSCSWLCSQIPLSTTTCLTA
eukprot:8290386-Karenia_brevis.AAC.1